MPSKADAGNTFTLRIERSMAGLEQLGGWVDTVAAATGLSKTAEFALRLCLEEATANVVMHGAGDTGSDGDAGFVALHVAPAQDSLHVTVEDDCEAFDPLHVPAATIPTNPDEARVGGLGVHLMRQYARTIDYARVGDVNRLTLTIGR